MANPTTLISTFESDVSLVDASGSDAWTETEPIRFDSGLWLEESGTNLNVNPVAGVDTSSWSTFADRTLARVTSLPGALPDWLSSLVTTGFSITATADLSGGNTAFQSVNMTLTANPAMGSMYVWVPAAYTGTSLQVWAGSFTSATGTTTAAVNLSLRDQWQRVTVGPFTPDAGDLAGNILLRQVSGTWGTGQVLYVTCAQMRQSSYSSSFIAGSLGDGYAWTGTAHASTSTRAASSVSVDQDGTNRIDPASGSIAFRYTRKIDTAAEEIILTSGVVGAGTDYLELGIDSTDHFYAEWNSNNAGANRVTSTGTISVDTEYLLYTDWDGTAIRVSIDNGAFDTDTRDAVEGDWSTGDLTLSAATGSYVVGPFLVGDRVLTSKEIATLNTRDTWVFSTLAGGNRYNIFQLRPRAA